MIILNINFINFFEFKYKLQKGQNYQNVQGYSIKMRRVYISEKVRIKTIQISMNLS